jgi:Predicted aminoglycoside phosphotransferase
MSLLDDRAAPDLTGWLQANVPGLVGPVELDRIGAGQSNLTFSVRDAAGARWVLRKPPAGRHVATAHDMHREARILRGLSVSSLPLPTVVGTGTDADGSPFYVMSFVAGDVLADEADGAAVDPTQRAALSDDVIGVLATLHGVDPDASGLGDLGPREGYLSRQIRRWERNWPVWGGADDESRNTAWAECGRRLADAPPIQQRVSVVHGDYRLSNVVVTSGRVVAVLDWELCSLGDPLADLAWLLDDWRPPTEPPNVMPSPTRAGGYADRDTMIARYVEHTGLDVSRLDYYRGFSHWRAATLLQGVLMRRLAGSMGEHSALDPEDLSDSISALLEGALAFLR